MVSQGRVGALIAAKPAQRRALLEEAAGISGLHSRRHEAELRLKGAEANLERLDDVLSALDGQSRNLRKQARQAAQYREISEAIRHTEAVVLRRRWLGVIRGLDQARTAFRESERLVAEATAAASAAIREHETAAEALAPLREQATEAAAALQRLVVERERLDAERKRVTATLADNRTRLEQTDRDRDREQARLTDAQSALARLTAEETALKEAAAGEPEARAVTTARLKVVNAEVNAREAEVTRLTQAVAEADAQRSALDRRVTEATQRAERLERRCADLTRELETARARALDPADVERAEAAVGQAETACADAATRREQAEAARIEARTAFDHARDATQGMAADRASLRAEVKALEQMLTREAPTARNGTPVLESLSADPGYETALGAALGDDLTAALDPAAPAFWADLPAMDDAAPLPPGVASLADYVQAPPALARALAHVGVVRDRDTGDALRHDLQAGQRLVSADGDLWRWDGLTVRAGAGAGAAAGAQAAARLRTRNRLAELAEALAVAETKVAEAEATVQAARDTLTRAEEAERAARDGVKASDAALSQARAAAATLRRKAGEADAKLASLKATLDQVSADGTEAAGQAKAARAERAEVGDGAEDRAALVTQRAALTGKRTALVEARADHDRLLREIGDRDRRVKAVADDLTSWTTRLEQGRAQFADLEARRGEIAAALAELEPAPERLRADLERLGEAIRAAEAKQAEAGDTLAVAETRTRRGDETRKKAEAALAQAREAHVRRESDVERGQGACRSVAGDIADRLDCTPDALPKTASLDPDNVLPPLHEAEAALSSLSRQRDGIGPVNLRAEAELAELDEKVAALRHEREDLTGAIARLRQAISEINREGRQRLVDSFTAVNEHFRTLFTGLFGGGRAHLEMIESNDPLEAGLEIMASPPGKRLQILSLLSGGEQALTALALLFAVFLTNPAPICVLDEVDAPLDDANVDRLCTLLEDLTRTTATRFLMITHHRMSMARMDRLFGVTMMERGVSKLVSVDLRQAEVLRDRGVQGTLL